VRAEQVFVTDRVQRREQGKDEEYLGGHEPDNLSSTGRRPSVAAAKRTDCVYVGATSEQDAKDDARLPGPLGKQRLSGGRYHDESISMESEVAG
jgi:hypothetical protein